MKVEELEVPVEQAKAELQALKEAVKQNAKFEREQLYRDLQRVYAHIARHGGKVIDVYEAFKKAGLNSEGNPKLAICRADGVVCYALKYEDGRCLYRADKQEWYYSKTNGDVLLPAGTFKWIMVEEPSRWNPNVKIKRMTGSDRIKTSVPIIPPSILNLVKTQLKNYHIIWEVKEWRPLPPKDPILVKKLTPNLFGVLATWNLTKLERAVIRGRIQ
jgi:hypothetical protein